MSFLGPLISGAASLLGGFINSGNARDANRTQQAMAAQNIAMQQEFAKNGIRWRVEDARKAGIHPLYALGAQTSSFSPVSVGTSVDSSLGSAVASVGQDISRAMHSTRTGAERDQAVLKTAQDLELTNAGLKNELLAVQIAKLKGQIGPPMPDATNPTVSGDTRSLTFFEGQPNVTTPKLESTQDAVSKEYGDEGIATVPGQVRIARDWLKSQGYSWSPSGVAKAIADGWLKWNTSLATDAANYFGLRPFNYGRR